MEPQESNLTPEERLFKIIQKEEAAGKRSDTLLSSEPVKPEPALWGPGVEPAPVKPSEDVHAKKAKRALDVIGADTLESFKSAFITLRTANTLLALSLASLLIYFVATELIWGESANEVFLKKAEAAGLLPVDNVDLSPLAGWERELPVVASRNLFRPWRPPEPSDAPQPVIEFQSNTPLASVIGKLKLSGVYMSDVPEALIEDKDENKTYTVTQGGVIKGLQVKEITFDSVTLTDGQSDGVLR